MRREVNQWTLDDNFTVIKTTAITINKAVWLNEALGSKHLDQSVLLWMGQGLGYLRHKSPYLGFSMKYVSKCQMANKTAGMGALHPLGELVSHPNKARSLQQRVLQPPSKHGSMNTFLLTDLELWWSLTGRKWHGFGLYLLFITAAFLRGTRGRIWCLCVIVLTPSHILSPVHLLSPLLICAVCLQISDILLRLGSGVPALPARRERDPQCIPWGASSIFSFLILL